VAIQESTNKIFIFALEEQHQDIAEIMKNVDLEDIALKGAVQMYPLENRKPKAVADMLKSLLESEKVDVEKKISIPGKEGAPIIVALDDIYAVAVRGSKKQHEDVEKIIKQLDKRLPQVLVEAYLVQMNVDDALNLGVSLKNKFNVGGTAPNKDVISGISPFQVSAGAPNSQGIVTGTGGTAAFYNNDFVYATLEALRVQKKGKVVSMPRVLVNDNETGTITSDQQFPTTTQTGQPGSDVVTTTFKGYEAAGTTLKIVPHISEGDFLRLEISLNVDSFLGETAGAIPPPKASNKVETIISVPNDKTIVLGGLTSQNNGTTINKIPVLGEIPVLGLLFRNVSKSETSTVLYVFVKANIVRSIGKEGGSDFTDLDELSGKTRQKLRDMEKAEDQMPVIPGVKFRKNQPSILDD
jgi:general secretion pathway protein D